ncbi:MAG TPA: protein kinase [Gemmatimonadaceae bacterium]
MTSELRDELQSSLAGSYTIERELGGGWMSHVFIAEEAALGRRVAVKVLRPDLFGEISAERFKRETLIAARLQHPNIVPVLTAGEAAGLPYYTMPFVVGESLETKLDREGALPVREATRLLSGVARALAYAHRHGVVHRDIKPGNVLVAEGTALVIDFGIAKAILNAREGSAPHNEQFHDARDRHGEDRHRRLTHAGATIGTPAYMAPEQIIADPATDYRADIYSFGMLAYEVLAGSVPFDGLSYQSLLAAHLTEVPKPLSELRPELPQELVALVARCLEKEPADRPASAEELVFVLESISGSDEVPSTQTRERTPDEVVATARDRAAKEQRHIASLTPMVARGAEEAELTASFEESTRDRGLLHAVVAEAGLGKSTLVDGFLRTITSVDSRILVGRGRCSERLAGAEAYLPVLEALEGLIAGSGGHHVARQMRHLAPAWYALVDPASTARLSDTSAPADARVSSSEQMKRQLGSLLLELSRSSPVILFLEDVHWADTATVDLIGYLADRFDTLRMLLLVTYRPSDLLLARHPFADTKLRLQSRGAARETRLRPFDRAQVGAYLEIVYPRHEFPDEFITVLHARTEGTPLFVADVVRQLANRGVITNRRGSWQLDREIESVASELPESVRSVIQRTIDRLDEEDRRLLVTASVQGVAFDSAVVAHALETDAAPVEERLERLERVHAIVRCVGEGLLAGRTPSLRYVFAHILYQNTLQATLRATRRMTVSAKVAGAMQAYHGDDPSYAAQLGVVHTAARQFDSAATYFLKAARAATRVFANKEAVLLARRGLDAVESMPAGGDQAKLELQLQVALGVPLTELQGYASSEVQAAYSRARDLCAVTGDTPAQIPVLHGLYRFYTVRGELHTAHDVVQQLAAIAEATGDSKQVVLARSAMGPPLIHLGEFEAAEEHLKAAVAAYDPQKQSTGWVVTGAFMPASWLAIVAWLLGKPGEALEKSQQARELAERQQYPFAVAYAQCLTAWLHQYRGDAAAVKRHAEAAIELSRTHDYVQWLALGLMFREWARVALGEDPESVGRLSRAIEQFRRTGAELNLPHFLAMLADAHGRTGDVPKALATIEDAIDIATKNDDRCWEPELRRLKGELLLQLGEGKAHEVANAERSAEESFREALAAAGRQKSRSLQLRAAVSLARLLVRQQRAGEAGETLAGALEHLADPSVPEVDEARAILHSLSTLKTLDDVTLGRERDPGASREAGR